MKTMNMRQEQAAATKRKLLESAQKMFAENGYNGTSVRMINRDANLADGLMYHYFPGGKKEIFEAVVRENVMQMKEDLDSRLSVERCLDMPLCEVLELAYVSFTETVEEHLNILSILLREKEIQEMIVGGAKCSDCGNHEPWLTEIFREKSRLGEVREMDFQMAAITVNSLLVSHVMAKVLGMGQSALEDAAGRKRIIDYQVQMWATARENESASGTL